MIRTHPKVGDTRTVRRFLWFPKTLRVCVDKVPILRQVRDHESASGRGYKVITVDDPVYTLQTRWLVWAEWEQWYTTGFRGDRWMNSPLWLDAHALKWREDEGDY